MMTITDVNLQRIHDVDVDRDVLLQVDGLCVEYASAGEPTRACTDVTFALRRGEILGVVGESGSGKSTLITALTRLQRAPAVTSAGSILYRPREGGEAIDLVTLPPKELRKLRWTRLSIVLQSAMDALNPVMRVGAQFVDVLREHDRSLSKAGAWEEARRLLALVGISADRVRSYPHELSGGMRQRATIALALACRPELIVMDEPTTAVDVVMQRQILAQVLRLRHEFGFAVVFVTHDLSLLLELADRIAVMYAGRIVELASAAAIYRSPLHPYTRGLRDSFPPLHAPVSRLEGIPGTPPDLRALPPGCAFADRCPAVMDRCRTELPLLTLHDSRAVACHLHDEEISS
ncbi:peptide/nickel transport system ATP-binding protein [Microbacterium endophyticum]|uniref:Peptide/nickel transport system ATP-binding protein n=1 Tax=Microbacterium endophyticum TaxID=1526412 RepID=A0A7W4V4C1_9MICO|nr:ABC transporter ATP-binding protein [Microbacterium endophyticum]MBB2976611.1 peptide/nickel transport system ATP-binding protein [Microbacterium endophyticum]NIK37506.1 peptide/nickel transport system ATP-binding protein [Microbacterium endophyticum]